MVIANYPEFVTLKFAISRLGAIAVPFNFLYKQDELAYVLADSGCWRPGDDDGVRRPGLPGDAGRHSPGWDTVAFGAPANVQW